MNTPNQICALCGQPRQLCLSHIIPKFVIEWLKDSSPSHIRSGENPNRRVQDGLKTELLCSDCEQLFSDWEHKFAETIFIPFHSNRTQEFKPIRYEKWALKFAVSVSWRTLQWFRPQLVESFPLERLKVIDSALAIWREFLLDTRKHPENFEQHLLPFDLIETIDAPNMSPNINRYFLTTIDVDLPNTEMTLFVYSKMCKLVLLGILQVPTRDRKIWRGTKLHVNNGYFPSTKRLVMPDNVMEYISNRANQAFALLAGVSPRQKAKIAESIENNFDTIAESEVFRALNQDVLLFGKAAFAGKSS